VPPRSVAHDGPVYERPFHRPSWQDALQADTPDSLPRPSDGEQLRATLINLIGAPNLASKAWITDQYDRYVLGNTVLAQPEDAGMIRVDELTGRGVAISTDCNGRYAKLDPYNGAKLALAESYRNVSVAGAKPLAVTNCLNFGSPEDPEVMWQFSEACRGLADGCLELGVPVTGGNVSFYNQTGDIAILPTPVVGVLAVIENVDKRTPMAWSTPGQIVYLLGDTRDEFAGSEWAHHVHGHLGGMPPVVDLQRERVLSEVLVAASIGGSVAAAHDISDGGIAITLTEMAMKSGIGVKVSVPSDLDPFVFCFAESTGRAIAVVASSHEAAFVESCTAAGLPATRLGETGGDAVEILGQFSAPISELRRSHEATIPAIFAS
jgi:phosphoribosylformylglycinamidine synthase